MLSPRTALRRWLGVEKAAPPTDLITHISGGWWPVIRESFAGAWQRGIVVGVEEAATHPTVWSCVTLIAGDIAKCRPKLVQEDSDDIETEVDNAAYSPVLRRPNHFQNRIQFYESWVLSKLLRGNAYALKVRDGRGVVTDLYLLDPMRVQPMVTPAGDVYYALQQDVLAGVTEASVVVPANSSTTRCMRSITRSSGCRRFTPAAMPRWKASRSSTTRRSSSSTGRRSAAC
jgi:hypothetical protein